VFHVVVVVETLLVGVKIFSHSPDAFTTSLVASDVAWVLAPWFLATSAQI